MSSNMFSSQSPFSVDNVTKYNDYMFIQGSICMEPFVDKHIVDDNVSTSEPFISGPVNIIIQNQETLSVLRSIGSSNEFIKNDKVRLYNDNGNDLGTIYGFILNSTTQKTMLRSIQLHHKNSIGEDVTNLVIINSYPLLNKNTIPANNKASVIEDFNKFVTNNTGHTVVLLITKSIYDILNDYKLFEESIDGFQIISVGKEIQNDVCDQVTHEIINYALEFTHGRRIVETEPEYNINVKLSDYEPLFVKCYDNSNTISYKCRTNNLEFDIKTLNKINVLSIFIKKSLDVINIKPSFESDNLTSDKLTNISLIDVKTNHHIIDLNYDDIALETDIYKLKFIEYYNMKNTVTDLQNKYNYALAPKKDILLELDRFMTSTYDVFVEYKKDFTDIYKNESLNEDNKLLFTDNRLMLVNIFNIVYIFAYNIHNHKLGVNNDEAKLKNNVLTNTFNTNYLMFNNITVPITQPVLKREDNNIYKYSPMPLHRQRSDA